MRTHEPYDEHYATCSYTHTWLRIMAEDMNPDEVTDFLHVAPTTIQRAGELYPPKEGRVHKTSGWWLSTKGILTSLDARHHFDWLLGYVSEKHQEFAMLRARGYLIDVCCRWDSKSGHGGPALSPAQLLGFARLSTEVWFDIYFDAYDGSAFA